LRWAASSISAAASRNPPGPFGRLAVEAVPPLLFVGALGYLLVSGAYGLMHRMSSEPDDDVGP